MTFGKIPLVVVNQGMPLVQGFATTLESISRPDQTKETFDFVCLPDGKYKLTHKNWTDRETVYTWDSVTNELVSDGVYNYKTVPPKTPDEEPRVTRLDAKGNEQYFYYDSAACATMFKDFDGVVTKRSFIFAEGPNYLNTRKIEKMIKGKWTTTLANSYDDLGHLIRSVKGDEILQQTWWPNGKMASLLRVKAGKTELQRQFDQTGRITEYQFRGNVIKYVYDGKTMLQQRYLNGKLLATIVDEGDLTHKYLVATDAAASGVQGVLPGEKVDQEEAKAALEEVRKLMPPVTTNKAN